MCLCSLSAQFFIINNNNNKSSLCLREVLGTGRISPPRLPTKCRIRRLISGQFLFEFSVLY